MEKMIPTKLNVFDFQFNVNTPQFLKEACENCNDGMYAICWNIFRNLLALVATRATEINDPIMNVLMLRLNLYSLEDDKPLEPNERSKLIKKIEQEVSRIPH